MADSSVRRAVAFVDVVAETVASCALNEGFGGNGDLRRDAFVVHEGRLVEEFAERGSCGVVDEEVYYACRSVRVVSGFRGPSGTVIKM